MLAVLLMGRDLKQKFDQLTGQMHCDDARMMFQSSLFNVLPRHQCDAIEKQIWKQMVFVLFVRSVQGEMGFKRPTEPVINVAKIWVTSLSFT